MTQDFGSKVTALYSFRPDHNIELCVYVKCIHMHLTYTHIQHMQCVCVFLQRKWAVLSLGQQVNIRPHVFDPRQDCLAAMVVEVDFLMKKKLVFIIII